MVGESLVGDSQITSLVGAGCIGFVGTKAADVPIRRKTPTLPKNRSIEWASLSCGLRAYATNNCRSAPRGDDLSDYFVARLAFSFAFEVHDNPMAQCCRGGPIDVGLRYVVPSFEQGVDLCRKD